MSLKSFYNSYQRQICICVCDCGKFSNGTYILHVVFVSCMKMFVVKGDAVQGVKNMWKYSSLLKKYIE